MNFDHFQQLMQNVLDKTVKDARGKELVIDPARLHPLVLAYVGDAFFTLYVRTRLLTYEQNKVRVLHNYDSKIVSAVMQASAVRALEGELTEEEWDVIRRGRNAKSTVPKSASVSEYRYSTGFEAMLGYLYLSGNKDRLSEIAEKAFVIISGKLTKDDSIRG